jgi:alanine-synthesizing transaminase
MFVWAPVPERFAAAGSLAFARHLLEVAHIAVSPGVGFGPAGDGHVRFSLVQDDAGIDQALEGIANALVEPLVGRAD